MKANHTSATTYAPSLASQSPKKQVNQLNDTDFEKQVELNTKLFLTYLKNQTPDDKVDTQQMMNTMLTMMSASQHIKTNKILTDQYQLQQNIHHLAMNEYLGKEIQYAGNMIHFDQNPVAVDVTLPKIPDEAHLIITDQSGRLVQTVPLIPTTEKQTVTWDGIDRFGSRSSVGSYQVFVHGLDHEGRELTADPSVNLVVDEVVPNPSGTPILKSGGIILETSKIQSTRLKKTVFKHPLSPENRENH